MPFFADLVSEFERLKALCARVVSFDYPPKACVLTIFNCAFGDELRNHRSYIILIIEEIPLVSKEALILISQEGSSYASEVQTIQ